MALNGKTAVVTGAAMGIGRSIAELLLQNGAKVAILDMNETAGQSLVETLNKEHGPDRALFLLCNVESEEEIKAAFQKAAEAFGAIDILCNNAGILNEEKWQHMISINLAGVIRGTYLALEHMRKTNGGGGGVIVNIASMAGLGPLLTCPVYTATKHGVIGFTRAVAAASAASNYGIRVNALCPSFVGTELFTTIEHKLGQFAHLKGAANQLVEKLGVLNTPEVAECILELVTDETKNGEAFMVCTEMKGYVPFPSLSSTDKP
ncbi:15-hydroxyprostaglandin dehydrogenase [NAD(+)]-like isoform X2 [Pundamilia nyererei]|uniref:15-hydroxyprostaglandin dehydrogenase [NAD(+)] n=1 Tax=Pundamilia nyererei TaxID=303518 RepID=A0A9Y6JIF8_9CICH|nr:PREDICTED: 15-hydroxyprostaglandin dehydrogenase [NAD(+)]-like isoform X2 [Pundamilia nyererei]